MPDGICNCPCNVHPLPCAELATTGPLCVECQVACHPHNVLNTAAEQYWERITQDD